MRRDGENGQVVNLQAGEVADADPPGMVVSNNNDLDRSSGEPWYGGNAWGTNSMATTD